MADGASSIPGEPPLSEWADLLEAACRAHPRLGVRNVRVLRETASTQDAARAASAGAPGWLVVAGRQTSGRGRLGRSWADTAGAGLAITLTLPPGRLSSVGAGLAVCRAANAQLPAPLLGLRWPNDVVERAGEHRKAAGVLIEVRDGLALLGIGVNVGRHDWPGDLRGRAAALHELGATCSRPDLACALLGELDRVAEMAASEVATEATRLDTLCGSRRRFVHDGRTYEGLVESIEADASIRVRVEGRLVELPGQSTSLMDS